MGAVGAVGNRRHGFSLGTMASLEKWDASGLQCKAEWPHQIGLCRTRPLTLGTRRWLVVCILCLLHSCAGCLLVAGAFPQFGLEWYPESHTCMQVLDACQSCHTVTDLMLTIAGCEHMRHLACMLAGATAACRSAPLSAAPQLHGADRQLGLQADRHTCTHALPLTRVMPPPQPACHTWRDAGMSNGCNLTGSVKGVHMEAKHAEGELWRCSLLPEGAYAKAAIWCTRSSQ